MNSFCEKHNLITNAQFGFAKHKSTEVALLNLKEYILRCFEEKKVVLGVFIDFSQAFDTINHSRLLFKLEKYGFRGSVRSLLASYLSHRTQYVCIENHHSSVKQILTGVPQGSILGPLLFKLYINDIVDLATNSKCILYADDVTLLFSSNSIEDATKEGGITQKMCNIGLILTS